MGRPDRPIPSRSRRPPRPIDKLLKGNLLTPKSLKPGRPTRNLLSVEQPPLNYSWSLSRDVVWGDGYNVKMENGVVWFLIHDKWQNLPNDRWAWRLLKVETKREERQVRMQRLWVPKVLSVIPRHPQSSVPMTDRTYVSDISTLIVRELSHHLRQTGDRILCKTCRLVSKDWARSFPHGDSEIWNWRVEDGVVYRECGNKWRLIPNRLWAWRRQDGPDEWWVDRRWCPMLFASTSPLPVLPRTVNVNAAAQRMPQELFETICNAAVNGSWTLRLVCQYWNSQCTPHLCERIDIRGMPERVRELWRFKNEAVSKIIPHVKVVENVPDYDIHSSSPWLHILSQACASTRSMWEHKGQRSSISIRGPFSGGHQTIRSIHFALGRSPPPSFSRGITVVVLTNVRFCRFGDLIHLACELPDLEELSCQYYSKFDSLPTELPRRRPRTARNKLRMVNVWHCIPDVEETPAYALAVCTLFLSVYNAASFFSEDEITVIHALLQLLHRLPQDFVVCYGRSTQDRSQALDFRARSGNDLLATILSVKASQDLPFNAIIDYRFTTTDEERLLDWARLNTALSMIGGPTRRSPFIVGFPGREEMVRVTETILTRQLPAVSSRMAIFKESAWYQASLSSEELRGKGEKDLAKVYS